MNWSRLFLIALLTFLWGNTWSTVVIAQNSAPAAEAAKSPDVREVMDALDQRPGLAEYC